MIRFSPSSFSRKSRTRNAPRPLHRRRPAPRLEDLEGRVLLSATDYLVTSTSGSALVGSGDAGSLPYVINLANSSFNSDGYDITFDSSVFSAGAAAIDLTAPLDLSSATTFTITGNPNVVISGGGSTQVFNVGSGTTATLDDLDIEDGASTGSGATGGDIENYGTLTIGASSIVDGFASASGGGIDNVGTLTITGSTIEGNSVGSSGSGGAIDNEVSGTLTIEGAILMSNTAGFDGGGVSNQGTADLNQDQLVANSAGNVGGAVSGYGDTVVSDSTIYGNSASNVGGGLSADSYDGTFGSMKAINDTIVDNNVPTGAAGGGVYAHSGTDLLLDNTIVGLNTAGTGASAVPSDVGGTLDTASAYNLIGTGLSGGLTAGSDGNQVGVAGSALGIVVNTSFSPPEITLSPGSPAIDAGSTALAVDPISGTLVTDVYGDPRIIDGTVDIGSYEAPASASSLGLVVASQPTAVVPAFGSFTVVIDVTAGGTVDTSYSGPVTLTEYGSTGAATGTAITMDAVGGVATFSGLSIGTAGSYTFEATSGSATSATTSTIIVGATGTGTGTGTSSTPLPTLVNEVFLLAGRGRNKHVAGIELYFSQPLGATAGDPANYVVSQYVRLGRSPKARSVRVSVDYSAGSETVGLALAGRETFPLGGQLEVVGSGPGGITSASGVALDGSDIGIPGNDADFIILPRARGFRPS